jgi:hypothetical protein
MNLCAYEFLSELQKLAGRPQITEGSSLVQPLGTLARQNEAQLPVQRLHKALAAGNPAATGGKVLSTARRTTQRGLLDGQPSR